MKNLMKFFYALCIFIAGCYVYYGVDILYADSSIANVEDIESKSVSQGAIEDCDFMALDFSYSFFYALEGEMIKTSIQIFPSKQPFYVHRLSMIAYNDNGEVLETNILNDYTGNPCLVNEPQNQRLGNPFILNNNAAYYELELVYGKTVNEEKVFISKEYFSFGQ